MGRIVRVAHMDGPRPPRRSPRPPVIPIEILRRRALLEGVRPVQGGEGPRRPVGFQRPAVAVGAALLRVCVASVRVCWALLGFWWLWAAVALLALF